MQDFDKLPAALQWALGIGSVLGGAIVAWFGGRAARNPSGADELERERDTNRDNTLRQAFTIQISEAKEAMAQSLSATRKSFYDEMRELTKAHHQECGELESRIRELENDNAVQKNQIADLQRRRAR